MKRFLPFAFSIGIFAGSAVAQNNVQFLRAIPSSYDPAPQIPQFVENSPDITLPTGHVYVKPPTKKGWTTPQIMAKGVTHWFRGGMGEEGGDDVFRNNPSYSKKEYYAVPRIREIFGLPGPDSNGNWWPNGYYNEDQARQSARNLSISPRLFVGETMEGADWVPSDQAMWGWFYDELVNRYEAQKAQDGIPYYLVHNYFTQMGGVYGLGQESRASHESLYNTQPSSWPVTMYHPGQTISRPNTILEGVYVNAPDLVTGNLLSALMRMELYKKMGKFTGFFVFNVHEWHPGFASRVDYADGAFYRSDKTPLDPNIQILIAFLSQEYGTMLVEWGLLPRQSTTKKPVDYYPSIHDGKDFWYPNGATNPSYFPYYSDRDSNRYSSNAYLGDMTHFGIVMWQATGGQVAGGTPSYATFKMDGGAWVNRTGNGSDIVASYFEKRGVTRVRIQGNKMMICYFNMWADNEPHTIEVQNPNNPGQTFIGTVSGNGVHAVLVTI